MTAGKKLPFLNKIVCGDSSCILKQIPDSTVDLVITSPPYYLQRSYGGGQTGEEWSIANYIDAVMEVFEECVRIVKDTGSIVFNMGDKYMGGELKLVPYRFAVEAVDRTKVDLINQVMWYKTNPTPRQYQKRFVQSTEPFFHFAKTTKYHYDLDEYNKARGIAPPAPTSKSGSGTRYKAIIDESDLSPAEKQSARDALQEAVEEVKAGKISDFRMKIRGVHAPAFGGQAGGRQSQIENNGFTIIRMSGRPLHQDVIRCRVESLKWNDHPAIYPEQIVSMFIALLTPKRAVVLDPYMGSGTTAVAAKKAGRDYIGVDINPKYCEAAQKRVSEVP